MRPENATFTVERSESLPPDENRAGDIFSRLGYRISDAVADLVDNSIDATASHVLVRFVRTKDSVQSVLIADNGKGMNADRLREAMRFGSPTPKDGSQLGKYGIGLKSASLSQARTVIVLSRQNGESVGRQWTLENIKKAWKCDVLNAASVDGMFQLKLGSASIGRSGTIVVWQRLEHLDALPQHLDRVLARTIRELRIELGIRFHRFIESDRVQIDIDQHFIGENESELPQRVSSLNPFAYSVSGHQKFPLVLTLRVGKQAVSSKCHIWPARSKSPGYRLGGGMVALRQGFYFYRNDRVIQAGGWNGVRADDGEPHLSLARVEIDLPQSLDSLFKLDVTKSHLDPAPEFIQAITTASNGGISFTDYLEQAQAVYRKQKAKERARFPFAPRNGFSRPAIDAITAAIGAEGEGRKQKVSFRWAALDHDEIFRVDRDNDALILNSRFRKDLAEGDRNDAPALKLALLFLLQDELPKSMKTKVSMAWIRQINHALIASLKDR